MDRVVPALLLTGLVAACQLVDQRSFERAGPSPAAAQLARADYAQRALPPPPLAVIRFGAAIVDWQGPLLAAARAAQARKEDVAFDLVSPIPVTASLATQDAAQRSGAQDAASVAEVLEADGVPADQIHIGSRGDAGQPPRQVEVYVR